MSFEAILFFIIILVIFFSTIRKKLVSVKTGDSERPVSWIRTVGEILSRISKEMESAKTKTSAEGTGWDRIIPTPAGSTALEKKKEVKMSQPLLQKEGIEESALPKEKKRAVSGKCTPFRISNAGVRQLRKAIVWSEILAPPPALRDEERKSELK
ncbi:MAG: hypothetical protein JRG68_04820 [Deltaproteobacteria bacterium]|nr:hypothetical protein [Deltaproteobacteria bacterium]